MSFPRKFLASFLAAFLALAPVVADARAGAAASSSGSSYSSLGSRGSRTYSAVPGAQTVQRSLTPATGPAGANGPAAAIGPGASSPFGYAQPSFAQRHPFVTGILGGIAGSWLGHLLFGSAAFGYDGGMSPAGGAFGSFILLFVLFAIGWGVLRAICVSNREFALMGPPGSPFAGGFATAAGRAPQTGITLTDSDFNAFADALNQIQTAWGNGDLDQLRRFVTPEMLSYFSEQLANNQSQALQNRVHHVVLLRGEPREAWAEGIVEYATVFLRWSAIDYTVRTDRRPTDRDFVVEGDPQRPVEAQEVWSFRRSQGGRWLLSAIQQI